MGLLATRRRHRRMGLVQPEALGRPRPHGLSAPSGRRVGRPVLVGHRRGCRRSRHPARARRFRHQTARMVDKSGNRRALPGAVAGASPGTRHRSRSRRAAAERRTRRQRHHRRRLLGGPGRGDGKLTGRGLCRTHRVCGLPRHQTKERPPGAAVSRCRPGTPFSPGSSPRCGEETTV